MSKRSDDPRRNNPFVNAETKRYIKIKKRKWQAYKFSRTEENFNTYKIARNTVTAKLRQAQYEYEQNLAAKIKTDNTLFWKYVSSKTSTKSNVDSLKKPDGTLTATDQETANILNEYFSNVFLKWRTRETYQNFVSAISKNH